MTDPWPIIGWTVLVTLALVYVGGVLQLWSMWRREPDDMSRKIIGCTLAMVWPFALGAAVARWLREMA